MGHIIDKMGDVYKKTFRVKCNTSKFAALKQPKNRLI